MADAENKVFSTVTLKGWYVQYLLYFAHLLGIAVLSINLIRCFVQCADREEAHIRCMTSHSDAC